jgi:5-methyltetrahydropteroyltriglutamate--homocysteine methyltransferase
MIETTIAGSLPKPVWLAEPEKLWASWRLSGAALREGQRDAALAWIKRQEAAGIDIVSDGEQFRTHFVHGFIDGVEGVDKATTTRIGIRGDRYRIDAPTVVGPVRRRGPVHSDEVRFCRAHVERKLKATLPGPMTICDTIANVHYPSRADMAMAFAQLLNDEARELEALGVDVIQFDEPAFNIYARDVHDWGIEALNRAAAGLRCTTVVHICYGYGIPENIQWKKTLGSEWRQYEEIFPLVNKSRVRQVSLECANSKVPMSVLRLLPDKEILVGAVDVVSHAVETPEQVAATLKESFKHVEAARVLACTNCGMAPLPRAVAEGKLSALGAGAQRLAREIGT